MEKLLLESSSSPAFVRVYRIEGPGHLKSPNLLIDWELSIVFRLSPQILYSCFKFFVASSPTYFCLLALIRLFPRLFASMYSTRALTFSVFVPMLLIVVILFFFS
ncbi:unnamed protein product [Schistosoma rodhaini]|nr:unnamed protein product [Schistosoma rodhaini]